MYSQILVRSNRDKSDSVLLDPLNGLIKELKSTKRESSRNGQMYIATLCENMLDAITLLRDDYDRLDKLARLQLIKTDDIRAFIDQQVEPASAPTTKQ